MEIVKEKNYEMDFYQRDLSITTSFFFFCQREEVRRLEGSKRRETKQYGEGQYYACYYCINVRCLLFFDEIFCFSLIIELQISATATIVFELTA